MSKYWAGFACGYMLTLLNQDLLGKERYLKAADLLWTNDPWWMWAIFMAVITFIAYLKKEA